MNLEKKKTPESRFPPNHRLFNSQQYSQNEHINTQIPFRGKGHTPDGFMVTQSMTRSLPPNIPLNMQQESSEVNSTRNHPIIEFNAQYNKLQQARMQQQMITHNEAMHRKQQTFAMRQMLNPPTMSRQASAINLHQVNTSTQTTPNAQQSQIFQNNLNLNNQYGYTDSIRGNVSNNFNEDIDLSEDLMEAYKKRVGLSLNPFARDIEIYHAASNNRCNSGAQSPDHQFILYREPSSSSATSTPTKLLKSPKTKRQPTSLVTFSGWLYKQGSEGLKAWKRRWFVLSDYCLFYYKGPEEDKLQGSILLPSYVLSECLPSENKAYRKFSFKLEHKNMRTYYLSSENGDYMRKWMRVIRAATLMQNFHEIQTRKMLANSTPISTSLVTNNDTHPKYEKRYQENYDQKNMHSSLNPFLIFDEDNIERQPLYMNAPPKPRRIQNEPEYPTKNEMSAFACSMDKLDDAVPMRMLEYEDVDIGIEFGNNVSSFSSKHHGLQHSSTTPLHYESKQKSMPPRPHSADFLDYESKRQFRRFKDFSLSGAYTERLPYRPKSSLELNSAVDNFYYSEASYAAKMRQSALYMQNQNLISKSKNDSRLNTLRYENDRKRLTNEFNNYTANYLCSSRWASTLPKVPKVTSESNNQWKCSSLTRNMRNNSDCGNEGDQYIFDLDCGAIDYDSAEMLNEEDFIRNKQNRQNASSNIWESNISAGTLLSKSHEELVLMLIQLRRKNDMQERGLSRRLKKMEAIQRRLRNNESSDVTATRLELMGKLEILREEVNKIEQQYEKTKPLVNLVDNMVKLGSLYRAENNGSHYPKNESILNMESLRLNQIEVDHRVHVVDDEKHWQNFNPCQVELNEKVQRLYELDQRLQEESNNLQILQQDKQDIEATLDELKHRLATNQIPPENYIASKKIQHSLQLELCKVHSELAEHACNLEITVSQNSKLEKELLILRQKWQESRDRKNNSLNLSTQNHQNDGLRIVDAFESELKKVRESVGDMKRQREELSMAVSQLTLDSQQPKCQAKVSKNVHHQNVYPSKYIEANWTETDIDSTQKRNFKKNSQFYSGSAHEPYYYDSNSAEEQWPDKQEIRTVRVVKRESERRNREKDRSNLEMDTMHSLNRRNTSRDDITSYSTTHKADPTVEYYHIREPSTAKRTSTITNIKDPRYNVNNTNLIAKNDNIFQSNTARAILNEMSNVNNDYVTPKSNTKSMVPDIFTPSQSNQFKRATPRKKKRHNTAPHSGNFLDYMAERDLHKNVQNIQRARDDLDMEVVLRSNSLNENAISGPPDVVRSAMGSSNEYLFN